MPLINFSSEFFMINLLEIESAIQQLPESDIRQLSEWLRSYMEDLWDRQIKEDLASGKLDHLIDPAEAAIAANQIKTLNGD